MYNKRNDHRGRGNQNRGPSSGKRGPQQRRDQGPRRDSRRDSQPRREAPPQQPQQPVSSDYLDTGLENQYLNSLIGSNHELTIVLRQGENIAGQLIWYDWSCLKLAPSDGSPSLLIPKANIKYLYET